MPGRLLLPAIIPVHISMPPAPIAALSECLFFFDRSISAMYAASGPGA
jgi:hypothetical protein